MMEYWVQDEGNYLVENVFNPSFHYSNFPLFQHVFCF